MVKTIFHADLDSFFASVEEIYDPSLKGKPFVVGGRTRRSVVGSASYAARKLGVKAGMPIFQVEAISNKIRIVEHNFDRYSKYSEMFFEELSRVFTNKIEASSIDECYLDVTELVTKEDPVELAVRIQRHVSRKLGLGVSIGVSTNKFLAKVAGDMKKPMGVTALYPKDVPAILWPLPIKTMLWVGPSTALNLNRLGIFTIGDLAAYQDRQQLEQTVGSAHVDRLMANANGRGDDEIQSGFADAKSIGHSETMHEDSSSYEEVVAVLAAGCDAVSVRASHSRMVGNKLAVKLRDKKFNDVSRSITLPRHTNDRLEITARALDVLDQMWKDQTIRLVGVTLSGLVKDDGGYEQLTVFNFSEKKVSEAKAIIDSVNRFVRANVLWTAEEIAKFAGNKG